MSLSKVAEFRQSVKLASMDKEAYFEMVRKAWKVPQAMGQYFARNGNILGADVKQLAKGKLKMATSKFGKKVPKKIQRKYSQGELELLREMKRVGYL